MKRENLKSFAENKSWLNFTIEKITNKKSPSRYYLSKHDKCVLVKDISDRDGASLSDHCWIDWNTGLDNFREGDNVSAFCGAYIYRRFDESYDYCIDPVWIQKANSYEVPTVNIPETVAEIRQISSSIGRWNADMVFYANQIRLTGIGLYVNWNWSDMSVFDSAIQVAAENMPDRQLIQVIDVARLLNGVPQESL